MAWYSKCLICNSKGENQNIIEDNGKQTVLVNYFCLKCDFHWQSEVNCSNLLFDEHNNPQCIRDGNIGECVANLCPKLKEIPLNFLGFNYSTISDP